MANDMVFDNNMNPAYIHTPENTKRWLQFRLKTDQSMWTYKVRIGTTLEFVTVQDYLKMKGSDDREDGT